MTSQEIRTAQRAAMPKENPRITRLLVSGAVLAGALAAITALAASPTSRRAASPAPQTTGSITGTVIFEGTPPERRKLDMSADPVCVAKNSAPVLSEDTAVNSNGTLPNVFVYLKAMPGTFKPPSDPVVLDQSGCMYSPHVLGVMADQPLKIVSSDATTHNIHFMSTQNPDWNRSQPPGASPLVRRFAHPEIMIKVHCNEHPWMSAYVAVTSNPYFAVTGDTGAFTISNVPPGSYTLGSWTALFGTQDQEITVHAGQATRTTFAFKAP